ncbi:MAG: hypothetical protein M3347_10775 [Armatimonadota bacterium]|nr:hypothetical protein [Armatimonadota bacterium]
MDHRTRLPFRRTVLALTAGLTLTPALWPHLPQWPHYAHATSVTPSLPAPSTRMPGPAPRSPRPSDERLNVAANLVSEAISVAQQRPEASAVVVQGAAALIPQLALSPRQALTARWMRLAFSSPVPSWVRQSAVAAFFDEAAQRDASWAGTLARTLPDPLARSSAFIHLSQKIEPRNWQRADEYATLAQRAARQVPNSAQRAQALTAVAIRLASLNPATRRTAVLEAASQASRLAPGRGRDSVLTDIVGAAALFDLPLARRVGGRIQHPGLRKLANARINLSEISQTTLMASNADRIAALAKAAAPYDMRAIPILLQLPPQPDVFRAIASALPRIAPTGQPGISVDLLERIWLYAKAAPPSVYRDHLQSRLARLMVLHNLWRGRDWGKQLTWKGGRIQVGAFLRDVIEARRSALKIRPLQQVAQRSINRAVLEARRLPPVARSEALLLIAGQLLG